MPTDAVIVLMIPKNMLDTLRILCILISVIQV
jgi:hypothetical protein